MRPTQISQYRKQRAAAPLTSVQGTKGPVVGGNGLINKVRQKLSSVNKRVQPVIRAARQKVPSVATTAKARKSPISAGLDEFNAMLKHYKQRFKP